MIELAATIIVGVFFFYAGILLLSTLFLFFAWIAEPAEVQYHEDPNQYDPDSYYIDIEKK